MQTDSEPCDSCAPPLAGVAAAMDSPWGIQRCDSCGIYEGDLEAAIAAAHLIGGTARFYAEGDDQNGSGRPCQDIGDNVLIASGTNPWVELDGTPVDWLAVLPVLDRPRPFVGALNVLAGSWSGSHAELVTATEILCPTVTDESS